MENFKERKVHAVVGPFKTEQDVELFKLYVHDTFNLKNVVITPIRDQKTEIFYNKAKCILDYNDLRKFNSIDAKKFRADDPNHPLFIRYYQNADQLCRGCGKRYHGDSTKCMVNGFKICFRCGKFHNFHEHKEDEVAVQYCVYCKSTHHRSIYCPRTRPKTVTFEEFTKKPEKKQTPPEQPIEVKVSSSSSSSLPENVIATKTYSNVVAPKPTPIPHPASDQSKEVEEVKKQMKMMEMKQQDLVNTINALAASIKLLLEEIKPVKEYMKEVNYTENAAEKPTAEIDEENIKMATECLNDETDMKDEKEEKKQNENSNPQALKKRKLSQAANTSSATSTALTSSIVTRNTNKSLKKSTTTTTASTLTSSSKASGGKQNTQHGC
jgi:hypothetical protein